MLEKRTHSLGFVGMYKASMFGVRFWSSNARNEGVIVWKRSMVSVQSIGTGARYDAEKLADKFEGRRFDVMRRRMQIAVPLTAFLSRVIIDVQMKREKERRPLRAKEFLDLITSFGPAFIKAGQALATRPDLLPPEYLTQLEKLQDRLPPFSNEVAIAQIEDELEEKLDSIFEQFDPSPVAAASIGQVYKAKLRTGEQVAVKVQRPDCEAIISMDLYILRELSGLLNRLLKLIGRDTDLKTIIDEFGSLIYEEMDYISEGLNGERFFDLYGDQPDVFVPRIHWKYTRRRVLTLEWVNGVRLTSAKAEDRRHLVETLLQCSLRQMLNTGFFHADPHGGNLLATDDGKLCYLDFGMMSTVNKQQRYGIIQAVVHLVNRDWESLVLLYVKLGFIPVGTDTKEIVQTLETAMPDVLDTSVADFNFSSVVRELGSIMYMYPFRLPEYYTAILRCMGVLEGVALQVDSSVKIVNKAYPFIASKLLTDPADELRDTLMLLLFKDGHIRRNRLENLLSSAATSTDYDFFESLDSFLDYLFEDDREQLRNTIAEDITDELDTLGIDMSRYLVGVMAHSNIGSRWMPMATSVQEPVFTKTMEDNRRMIELVIKCQGLEPFNSLPILRRVITEPPGRKMSLEVAAGLIERATARVLRCAVKAAS